MWLSLLLLGCGPEVDDEPLEVGLGAGELSTARVMEEGTPEALGVLAFLNDAATKLPVLDDDVGLDKRAATNLIAHRDGATRATADDDKFDTVAEIDAVAYVGDAALAALLTYARAEGWVPTGEDFYGAIEGVEFTYAQAEAVVATANSASEATLDDEIGLDARAAGGIVAARPFTTVEQVAAVSYVGKSALEKLRAWEGSPQMTTAAAKTQLETVVSGLYWTSESDYPMDVLVIEGVTSLTATNAKTVLADVYVPREGEATLADRTVERWTVSRAFDRYTTPQSWWDAEYLAAATKWQAVRDVFDVNLEDATVIRLGETSGSDLSGAIDVYVFGVSSDGDLVGFHTITVET